MAEFQNNARQMVTQLEDIMIPTPNSLRDSAPTFILEDAVAVYADGSFANLLVEAGNRKVFIQGRLMCDKENWRYFKSNVNPRPQPKGRNEFSDGWQINIEYTHQVVHSAGPPALWFYDYDKWFEFRPAEEYTVMFLRVLQVTGIYWENYEFADANPQFDDQLNDPIYLENAFMKLVSVHLATFGNSTITYREMTGLILESKKWLLVECSMNKALLDKSPLVLWLRASKHTLPDVDAEIADLARNCTRRAATAVSKEVVRNPSILFSRGIEDLSDFTHITHVIAMQLLKENGSALQKVSLKTIRQRMNRDLNVGQEAVAEHLLVLHRDAILRDLPAALNSSTLRTELEAADPTRDPSIGSSAASRKKFKHLIKIIVSGERPIAFRSRTGDTSGQSRNSSASNDLASTSTSARRTLRRGSNKSTENSSGRSSLSAGGAFPDPSALSDAASSTYPAHAHLSDVTSFSNGLLPVRKRRSLSAVNGDGDEEGDAKCLVKRASVTDRRIKRKL